MRKFLISALALFVLGVIVNPYTAIAGPAVVAHIDKGKQTMRVSVNGRHMYTWKVSTAAYSFHTPSGSYRPKRMHTMWRSRKYHNSPMPHSIFFKGGYAVHGTGSVSRLGRPASHGCVRLHPANAKKLFNLVRQHGMANSRISLSGAYPYSKADRKYGKAVRYADAHPHVRKKKKRRAAKKKRSRRTVRTASRRNFFDRLFDTR